jgi:hypothetical protein
MLLPLTMTATRRPRRRPAADQRRDRRGARAFGDEMLRSTSPAIAAERSSSVTVSIRSTSRWMKPKVIVSGSGCRRGRRRASPGTISTSARRDAGLKRARRRTRRRRPRSRRDRLAAARRR